MKKTLIVAGVLAMPSGMAHAQTSVTLYGAVDTGVVYSNVQGYTSRTGIDSGIFTPSRFGIQGTEQLSGDLSAVFVLENGFSPDNGTATNGGRLFGRDAYVGLKSQSLGSIRLGRTTNLGQRWAAWITSPFGLSYGTNAIATTFVFDDADYGGGRVDNAVYYESPRVGGFILAGGYSFNVTGSEAPGASNNTRLGDMAVRYDNGPLSGIAQYMTVRTPVGQRNPQNLLLGASYDFVAAKVYVGYNRIKDALSNAGSIYSSTALGSLYDSGWVTGNRNDDNAYSVGVSVPLGSGLVMAGYQRATSQKMDAYGLAYMYNLTKRTALHAFVSMGSYRDFNTGTNRDRQQAGMALSHMF